jgi:6,7-dimethyl-8-ribityllumazine synthase
MAGTVSLSIGTVDPTWRIAIVRAAWHPDCVNAMVSEAQAELIRLGISKDSIIIVDAPGSFEIPLLCQEVISKRHVHGVIAYGVIVQGQTHHARLVAEQAAVGIQQVQLKTGVPIAFEVLLVDDIAHAKARATGEHGKGPIAAKTVLQTLAQLRDLGS